MSERHSRARYQTFCDYRGKDFFAEDTRNQITSRLIFVLCLFFCLSDFDKEHRKHRSVIGEVRRIVNETIDAHSFAVSESKVALTCLLKTATSSLKESDEHTSPPATPGSRGVHVASSHFSNINASSGNSGCLQ